MEVHRFETVWIAASLALIVAFIGTVVYGAVGAGVTMVDDDGGTVDVDAVADGDYDAVGTFREPGVYRTGPDEYAVYIVARQFFFEPGTNDQIHVPAGSTVTFYVTSADVTHGFDLVGTNVNTMAIPGQVAQATVRFEEPAEYGIVCHEYCGAGHHKMAGNMTVVRPATFDPQTALRNPNRTTSDTQGGA